MDVNMRDANRRGGGRRNGPSDARAARRSDPYARDSRARPNAAAANQSYRGQNGSHSTSAQPAQSQSGMSYPPPELSIRGSSGPTWIVVSNLIAGTSNEDVRLTFGAFGRVEEVKQRPAPSANHPTVGFEVAFERKEDAENAADKFNGALADGRILQVTVKKPETPRDAYSQFNRATAQAVAQRPREKAANMISVPAPLPYTPAPVPAVPAAIPTGPASMRSRVQTAALVEPRARKSNNAAAAANNNRKGGKAANAPAVPTGPKKASVTGVAAAKPKPLAQRIPEPLANRLLTQEQARKVRAEEAKKKARDDARAEAIKATGKHTALGKRLGGLPLAQRLVQSAGTPKSDASALRAAAEKKKRRRDAVKAKKAKKSSGMDLDG
ncbi:RNA recognition motif domain protein [Kalmanozyma brasiliensis GHG001]|uniref:RRM domain-containing protein n=1 Tax=Kalmanozyma brasiliensis (strain GHG001) TaxID=1365824 RepID=V5EFQ7_KALBG|nr:RNA recognition motif domain protein [Kalmanozyma brasiliensis GHG001]EST09351.1 RNA recognition motif domain protein [Kalmanozyma brasiliensis GHG001]